MKSQRSYTSARLKRSRAAVTCVYDYACFLEGQDRVQKSEAMFERMMELIEQADEAAPQGDDFLDPVRLVFPLILMLKKCLHVVPGISYCDISFVLSIIIDMSAFFFLCS